MQSNTLAHADVAHLRANFFNDARNFMPKCERHRLDGGDARAIMRIRMTDSRSGDPNQNAGRSDLGNWNVRFLERFSDLHESHRSHFMSVLLAFCLDANIQRMSVSSFVTSRPASR